MKKIIYVFALTFAFNLSLTAQVNPLINNDWQTFMWPYNAYYPEDQNGVNGHVGNACGYTSLARILHYWQYPNNGNGVLDFDDYFGHHWYIDLENMNLNYNDMPYALNWDDPEDVYEQTASLFLACGAIGEDIMIGFTDGIFRITEAMPQYMGYSEEMEVIQRWDYTRQEWIDLFKNELDNNRPILIDGRTPESPPPWEPGSWEGHFFVCDGYNENNKFHINYMYGGIKGYYDIDSMENFSAYHRAIINFEPVNVSNKETLSNNAVGIQPIPASEFINIEFAEYISSIDIRIFDLKGNLIKSIQNYHKFSSGMLSINIAELKAGTYVLKLFSADLQSTHKFIKR